MLLKLIWIAVLLKSAHLKVEEGYYWKNYKGGNVSKNCLKLDPISEVYVGQMYTRTFGLVPAAVYTTQPLAVSYSDNTKFSSNDNVKILCSQFPNQFRWVNTSAQQYPSLPNLVRSGGTANNPLYIGRVNVEGNPMLGIVGDEIVYVRKSKKVTSTGPFEVLVYEKPSKPSCRIILE